MSKIIASAAIRGGHACVRRGGTAPGQGRDRFGRGQENRVPATAYALPVTLALTGKRGERLGELEEALGAARSWLPAEPTERLWLPYLGGALGAGAAPPGAQEATEALKPLRGIPTAFDYWLGPT